MLFPVLLRINHLLDRVMTRSGSATDGSRSGARATCLPRSRSCSTTLVRSLIHCLTRDTTASDIYPVGWIKWVDLYTTSLSGALDPASGFASLRTPSYLFLWPYLVVRIRPLGLFVYFVNESRH